MIVKKETRVFQYYNATIRNIYECFDVFVFCCSSDMSGASNTLAREFLTDVHQLCSAVAQRSEAREEDEEESHMVALGEYLVRGRGFLLLSTLDSIIDQVRRSQVHPSWLLL